MLCSVIRKKLLFYIVRSTLQHSFSSAFRSKSDAIFILYSDTGSLLLIEVMGNVRKIT